MSLYSDIYQKIKGGVINEMEIIASYMSDDIREDLHNKFSPCTNEFFLKEYCKNDDDFEALLFSEFGIDILDLW